MIEALRRHLPHCNNDPYKVAMRLDLQHRNNDVHLLAGGVVIAPGSNPSLLGIVAHIPPDGRAVLYVQIRQALSGNYPVWEPGGTVESLERHRQFWTFERESFDAHSPDQQGGALQENANHEAPSTPVAPPRIGEDQPVGDQELTQPPAHRPEKVIPRWEEAMEYAGKQRRHNPAIAGSAAEMRSIKTWLSDRGIYIVESNDENKKKAELNPTLHPYSDRQLQRRIENWFKDHPDRS
jgi:hypothetical protein